MTKRERLAELLDRPELRWLLDRLRRRLRHGGELTGTVTLTSPSPDQRRALDALLGRKPSRGKTLGLRLADLDALLRHAELADGLRDAVETLFGPIRDEKAVRARRDAAWRRLLETARQRLDDRQEAGDEARRTIHEWLESRRTRVLLRRYTRAEPEAGRRLLGQALDVIERLPAPATPLPELAAAVAGDSHALDPDRPLGVLVVHAAALLGDTGDWHGARHRRDAWASVGVLVDELSAPALVFGLHAAGDGPTDEALRLHADHAEPYRLSTRQLLRRPPRFDLEGRVVFVCENPTILAAAADRLGSRSAPLVCVEGIPSTAVRLLLDHLARAGARLRYHGDFDWPGIGIAGLVMERHGALPWRYGVDDYLSLTGGTQLAGAPRTTAWEPRLRKIMIERGRAFHEEASLEDLLADLGTCHE